MENATEISISDLTAQQIQLLDAAIGVRRYAYVPYSGYKVGAALLTVEGKIFDGINVENAAYPLSMCAERTVVFKANSEGYRDYSDIAIATSNAGISCGGCRQVLSEFAQLAGHDITMIFTSVEKDHILMSSIYRLLPSAFGPIDIEEDVFPYLNGPK